jgi:hypothetical protein
MTKRTLIWVVPTILAILLQLSLLTGIFSDIVDADGFYSGFVVLEWLFYVVPAVVLLPPLVSLIVVKENRLKFFTSMLLVGVLFNTIGFTLTGMYNTAKQNEAVQQMYTDDPQRLPLLDPNRPLTIMKPWLGEELQESLEIEVYAHIDYVSAEESLVAELRSDLRPDVAPIYKVTLSTEGKKPEGEIQRTVHTGSMKLDLDLLEPGIQYYVLVRSESNLLDIREVALP